MTKTSVKPRNILLTMKERNEKNVTFSVAFCLLVAEKENIFLWALDKLKELFFRVDSCPRVVVCDRDVALMSAIRMVFPKAYNLLCRFHIDKNVKEKCKMLVHPRETWDQVMEVWGSVVDCDIVEAFEDRVHALRVVCSPWPVFVDYVMDTWLRPHKEKFVKAWIDKVTHLGNTTSNRVEAAHCSLKRVLQNSMGDLCFCWDSINKMIILQHNAIKASFQKSLHVVGHRFKVTAYK